MRVYLGGDCKNLLECDWCGDQRKRHHLEDLGVGGKIILKWFCKKQDEEAWVESTWRMIATSGELL